MPRRTAHTIAEHQARESVRTESGSEKKVADPVEEPTAFQRGKNPNSLANLRMFIKGQSGNPGGRPKDVAGALARAVIEDNIDSAYDGFGKKLAAGDAYAFSVLSDRGYGKLKQGIIHTGDEDGGPVRQSITVEFVEPKS